MSDLCTKREFVLLLQFAEHHLSTELGPKTLEKWFEEFRGAAKELVEEKNALWVIRDGGDPYHNYAGPGEFYNHHFYDPPPPPPPENPMDHLPDEVAED